MARDREYVLRAKVRAELVQNGDAARGVTRLCPRDRRREGDLSGSRKHRKLCGQRGSTPRRGGEHVHRADERGELKGSTHRQPDTVATPAAIGSQLGNVTQTC